jgi:hypothetical protein
MKMTSLKVSTPEGNSGRILTSAEDFIFRYDDVATTASAKMGDLNEAAHFAFLRRNLRLQPSLNQRARSLSEGQEACLRPPTRSDRGCPALG